MLLSAKPNPNNKENMKRAVESATTAATAAADTSTTGKDLSILRKPIKTTVTGFNEARKAYENGTQEVKHLLSHECDIIYECKVCRNMFRSLANFISHKRIYCQQQFNATMHFGFGNDGSFSQDLTTIVQAENDYLKMSNGKHQDKDLGSIIERLAKRERTNRMLKLNDFYEQVNKKLTQDEIIQQNHVLQLEQGPETKAAVYQTARTANNGSIKTEINEIDELLRSEKNVLGPDGKLMSLAELPYFNNSLLQNFECEICNSKFSTEKTLKLHIQAKHIPSTYVYQCPSCSQTFLKASLVIRHLINDHKKSLRRIRQMRDTIFKRRTRLDEVQVKGPSRELTRLQTDKERDDAQKKAWLDNLENSDSGSICTYCGKKFDRRAVLISHTKVCQNKNKTNSILVTKANDHDDSSNSNSFDAFLASEENSKMPQDDQNDTTNTNRRKRKRAFKAVINESQMDLDDDKSMNLCWISDSDNSVDESRSNASPITELNTSEQLTTIASTTTWNIIDPETKLNICTIEETPIEVKEESKSVSNPMKSGERPSSKAVSKCKVCNKTFSNVSNLRRHMQTLHFRIRKFACLLCQKFVASRKPEVIQHVMTDHVFDGERNEALQFVTIREEEIGGKAAFGSSRRKNKHTAVLKDDVELTIIEQTEAEAESEPATPMDTSNENSNAGLETENNSNESTSEQQLEESTQKSVDDVVERNDEETAAQATIEQKRKGRPKGSFKDVSKKSERTELTSEMNLSQTRRPVRNRTMPVKKDFVYDLATLLKGKDVIQRDYQQQSTPGSTPCSSPPPAPTITKAIKHRHSLPASFDNARNQSDTENKQTDKPVPAVEPIKGSAHAMAMIAVNKGLAAFYKPPELPTERTTPIKNTTKQREYEINALKDWPIVKKPNQVIGARKMNGGKVTVATSNNDKVFHSKRLMKRLSSQPTLPSRRLKSSENILLKLNGKSWQSESSSRANTHAKHKGWTKKDIDGNKSVAAALTAAASEGSEVSGSDTDTRDAQPTAPRRKTLLERLAEIRKITHDSNKLSMT